MKYKCRDFFSIVFNKELKSLEGSPISCKIFNMSTSGIINMKGCPQKIEYSIYADMCRNLESLEGCAQHIPRHFDCSHSPKLMSLEGGPKYVGGVYTADHCGGDFTEDDVRSVCKMGKESWIKV